MVAIGAIGATVEAVGKSTGVQALISWAFAGGDWQRLFNQGTAMR